MFEDDEQVRDVSSLPIYKKGEEIVDTVIRICDLIPESNELLQPIKAQMLADASILVAKVAGAEAGELYDIRMEAAAFIRRAANDLKVQNHSLEMFGFEFTEYFDIVRSLIEEYRILFIQWVAGFDKWDYVIDRWGLFNPPGVGPFDKDPDEDLPFDRTEE